MFQSDAELVVRDKISVIISLITAWPLSPPASRTFLSKLCSFEMSPITERKKAINNYIIENNQKISPDSEINCLLLHCLTWCDCNAEWRGISTEDCQSENCKMEQLKTELD